MTDRLPHFVSDKPFNIDDEDALTPEQERYYLASQWQMMWWRFKRHKIAVIAGVVLILSYATIFITEFLAPYALDSRHTSHIYAPPQGLHLFHEGSLIGPFVYPYTSKLNLETLKREYQVDRSKPQPIRFFCLGDPYKFWGLIEGRFHFVCPPKDGTLFLLGTDRLGRDMASRLLYGGRISLSIGLIGISISFILGITIGGVAGYFGGWIDNLIQRLIEILRSLPELPLWMA
ncbi:MAG: ABC transporter permease, partial [Hyphomicrobiaceae bacterium]